MTLPYLVGRRAWLALAGAAVTVAVAALLAVFDVGGLRTRLTGTPSAPRIESLAVLPLENLSGDPGQEFFADGTTEMLITDLARLGGLRRVTARGSVMRYKGTRQSFAEIARELKVDALVTGSVLRSGSLVSVTVQLINPFTEDQLWTNRYERALRDVIRLQNDIVSAIVGEIRVQLTPGEQARLASARAVNPEAYDAYLKGRVETDRLSPKNLEMAMGYFDVALQKDPEFALAHAGIARVWLARGHLGFMPPREAIPWTRAAASRALELDENLPEAHRTLASMYFYFEWNWEAAMREWQRAIQLDPNNPDMRVNQAAYFAAMGQPEGTDAAFEQALESDPHNPQLRDFYGHQLLRLRRYDEAIVQFQRVLGAERDFHSSLSGLWRAFHVKQMHREAVAHAERYLVARGYPEAADTLEQDYARSGYADAMRGVAGKLAERSKTVSVLPTLIARTYAFAGETDLALQWLEKAYRDNDTLMVYLKVDPTFDAVRDHPRFQALLQKMNFPL